MPPARYQAIQTVADFDLVVEHSLREPVVLYKHSRLCDLCFLARRRLKALQGEGDPPVFEVVVQDARPLSNKIAEAFGIRHESPQVIVLSGSQPVFHASHRGVTARAVREAVACIKPS